MPSDESLTKEETTRRAEAAIKQMLATPHKPHAESASQRKRKPAKTRRPSTGKAKV